MALEERRLMHLLSSLIGHSLSPADVGVETDELERSEVDMQLLPSKKLYDRLPQRVMVTSYQVPAPNDDLVAYVIRAEHGTYITSGIIANHQLIWTPKEDKHV
ncbi:hypothetical protein [Lacticaseibacillus saniviri]|nr:hypothetical protein [Lacticaseibacillus saniviri]